MTQPETWKTVIEYVRGGWTAIGPLVGVLVGAWLARSWDKEKWLKDNRKQECRELLTAVTNAATAILDKSTATSPIAQARKTHEANDAYLTSVKVFQDRIFIAPDVERAKLFDLWPIAVNAYNTYGDRVRFDDSFEEIKKKIVEMALKQ
jgi:hypothetical protein